MMTERIEKRLCFGLFLIGAGCFCIFWFASCSSAKQCTQKKKNRIVRNWYKGQQDCPEEMARLSLLTYPTKQTDSVTGVRIKQGEQVRKTDSSVTYSVKAGDSAKGVPDTIIKETKLIIDNSRTDTIFVDKVRTVEDQRGLLVRDAEIKRLEAEAAKREAELAVNKKVSWYKTLAISGLLLFIIGYFGIKYGLAKYRAAKKLL